MTYNEREKLWLNFEAGKTPSSTTIHPEFIELLTPTHRILDIGCGNGRAIHALKEHGEVVGIDINGPELQLGLELYPEMFFIEASAKALPFADNSFDAGMELALLGGVDGTSRQEIMYETSRILKSGAIFYLAEFARIEDPKLVSSRGVPWVDIYERDRKRTGELGSIIVRGEGDMEQLIVHHFVLEELVDLLETNQFTVLGTDHVMVKSAVSGQMRPNWNVWAVRQ